MSIKVVLFDLDGTLLPMEQDAFTGDYFKRLAVKLTPYGYEPNRLIKDVWAGTAAMVKNDGGVTNEEAFWNKFAETYGEKVYGEKEIFEDFYRNEFQEVRKVCGFNEKAAETVRKLREMGLSVALATNPLFPKIATESRIRWAGLSPDDFELYTTYEDSRYCKPNPDYYREVLERAGAVAEECLMVGNDVTEDMVAQDLGMKVFLLTDCLINKENRDISVYPHGDFEKLQEYLNEIK